ncbi:MAG: ABC transporter ATP-binding protein [Deltaproteobacteria bacterium]|nr:ABC transporter ATP-binding protein [Deltaproteobacteria bacterium]
MRSLVASSGAFRLRPTSLEVASGELLVLLGPSGAGKTVLLESLLGLRTIHEGSIVIDGRDVTSMAPEERLVAYMPQDVALFPHLSVRENIDFGRRVRGQRDGLREDVARIAESLGIAALLERPSVRSLSGGEAQRVALARALVTQPRVLFLDESFSALDAHIRRRLLLQFRSLQQEMKLTTVYVTHSLVEAALVADRVAVLIDGAIAQVSTPQRMFREPRDLEVARFLQLDNIFRVSDVDGTRCRCGATELELASATPISTPAWGTVPASEVLLLHPGDEHRFAQNHLRGRITAFEERHGHSRITVTIDDDLSLECDVTLRDRQQLGSTLAKGGVVDLHIPPGSIALLPER